MAVQELTLDTIITEPKQKYAEKIRVKQYSVHPYEEAADVWFELGYVDAAGGWVKTDSKHVIIKNIPEDLSDPENPVPADPQFDDFALAANNKDAGVSFESLFFGLITSQYPGTIA
jgi:hypothetical protein